MNKETETETDGSKCKRYTGVEFGLEVCVCGLSGRGLGFEHGMAARVVGQWS